ncbi:50S ribosomal L9 C-terminal domain-containing protein, partial [Clostridium sp.]
GDNGRLFGAITNKDIAEVINNKFNLSIDKKKIVVNTIKVAGEYEVEVKLYPEVSTKMKVIIVPKQ